MRLIAEEILFECGYSVLTATGGAEGIEIFKDHFDSIKAVLLDMSMPRMSGLETFEDLQRIDPKVTVLLTSGFKKDERVSKAIEKGAAGFLQKPYDITSLSEKIHDILS